MSFALRPSSFVLRPYLISSTSRISAGKTSSMACTPPSASARGLQIGVRRRRHRQSAARLDPAVGRGAGASVAAPRAVATRHLAAGHRLGERFQPLAPRVDLLAHRLVHGPKVKTRRPPSSSIFCAVATCRLKNVRFCRWSSARNRSLKSAGSGPSAAAARGWRATDAGASLRGGAGRQRGAAARRARGEDGRAATTGAGSARRPCAAEPALEGAGADAAFLQLADEIASGSQLAQVNPLSSAISSV